MGPNIVPCGTPALMLVNFDVILPTFTRCLRWHRNDASHLVIQFSRPCGPHIVSRIWWSTLSNGLLKSTSYVRTMVSVESSAYFQLALAR